MKISGILTKGTIPAAGETIYLFVTGNGPVTSVVSGAGGIYEFDGLSAGSYGLHLPGGAEYPGNPVVLTASDIVHNLDNFADLSGILTDGGTPRVNATVWLFYYGDGPVRSVVTDASGRFHFAEAAGPELNTWALWDGGAYIDAGPITLLKGVATVDNIETDPNWIKPTWQRLIGGPRAFVQSSLVVGAAMPASGPVGAVVRKVPVYDDTYALIGYLPVYDEIS